MPHELDGVVRDSSWQEEYMASLANKILLIVEQSVNEIGGVPAYLAKERSIPFEMRPVDLTLNLTFRCETDP